MLVTAASGGGFAVGQMPARRGAARLVSRLRSPARAATLAAACAPVTPGEGLLREH